MLNLKPFHISHAHHKIGLNPNLTFWISMVKESFKTLKGGESKKVLDFGCGRGGLLDIFDLMTDLDYGLGVELDADLIQLAQEKNTNSNIEYKLINQQNGLEGYTEFFDVVYSQEVLYTIEDLSTHAKDIFQSLKAGGFYFATMGCHIQNPLWSLRRNIIRNEEKYYAFDYSLDQVSEIFYKTGFEVALKRLPVEYFLVYHPQITRDFSNSLFDLVNSTHDYKMLFCFWKPYAELVDSEIK